MYDANSRTLSKIRTSAATYSSPANRGADTRVCRVETRLGASAAIALLSGLLLQACGVVGDVLPPTLNLPVQATDLTVREHADRLEIAFKMPTMTTEGMLIRHVPEIDLRIGVAPENTLNVAAWASRATRIPAKQPNAVAAVAPWVNKKVAISVRLLNERGKDAGWSPFVFFSVVPPVPAPAALEVQVVPSGVHLQWKSSAPKFRVFRHLPTGPGFEQIATPEKPEYDDNVEFGKEYSYYVQAIAPAGDGTAESDNSATVSVKPIDTFPPAAPVGLTYILGGKTIELTWTRNTETDLKGYRVYRAFENNPVERITDTQDSTSYSDRNIAPGKVYKYSVTAIDLSGNESKMSEPVTVTAP